MDKWKEQRLGLFTASEIYKIIQRPKKGNKDGFTDTGMTYIYEIVGELLTGQPRPETSSKAIEWGTTYEPYAMAFYKNRYDPENKVVYFGKENPQFFSLAPEHNCGGSPDGLQYDVKIVEVKNPINSAIHIRNLFITLEEFKQERKEYYAQMECCMVSTGVYKGEFVSFDHRMLNDDDKMRVLEVPYDKDYVNEMFLRVDQAYSLVKELYRKRKPLK